MSMLIFKVLLYFRSATLGRWGCISMWTVHFHVTLSSFVYRRCVQISRELWSQRQRGDVERAPGTGRLWVWPCWPPTGYRNLNKSLPLGGPRLPRGKVLLGRCSLETFPTRTVWDSDEHLSVNCVWVAKGSADVCTTLFRNMHCSTFHWTNTFTHTHRILSDRTVSILFRHDWAFPRWV